MERFSLNTFRVCTTQKMKFFTNNFFSKCDQPNPQIPADSVTFTEEILSGKLHFLCSDVNVKMYPMTRKNRTSKYITTSRCPISLPSLYFSKNYWKIIVNFTILQFYFWKILGRGLGMYPLKFPATAALSNIYDSELLRK